MTGEDCPHLTTVSALHNPMPIVPRAIISRAVCHGSGDPRSAPLVAILAVSVAACGSASPAVEPTSEFTEAHALAFEDGIDVVGDPEALEGRWRDEWSRELQMRVADADLLAIVTVKTIRTDTNLDRESTYRLIVDVNRVLLGQPPRGELSLASSQRSRGFASVDANIRRVLDQRFVAYIKWYLNEHGTVAPHWHLAPATDAVVRRTSYLIERRRTAPDELRAGIEGEAEAEEGSAETESDPDMKAQR